MDSCPIRLDALSPAARRAADPKSLAPARTMAARGLAPMPPKDLVTAQFVLTFDPEPKVADTAAKSLSNLDPRLATAVLGDTSLSPFVLEYLARALVTRDADIERILLNPTTPIGAVMVAAEAGSEAVCELIANNQARLLEAPEIARSLTANPKALKSTIDRVIDFLVRSGIVLEDLSQFDDALLRLNGQARVEAAVAVDVPAELVSEEFLSDEDREDTDDQRRMIADDEDMATDEEPEQLSIDQLIRTLTTGQKVALATKGTKSVRAKLIRDTNRVVALAAISAPTVQETEAIGAAQSRTVHADVIGYISRNKDWMKNYQVKLALASNPKTPLPTAMRMVPLLQRKDCKNLGQSKNVPAGVRNLAKKMAKQR